MRRLRNVGAAEDPLDIKRVPKKALQQASKITGMSGFDSLLSSAQNHLSAPVWILIAKSKAKSRDGRSRALVALSQVKT
jgi:hypothetical protein